jgi:two-component system, sensor histidine kinase LadS
MPLRFFSGLILFIVSSVPLFSQTLPLTSKGYFELGSNFSHLRDPGGSLTLEDVLKNSSFVKSGVTNYGFDDAAHWFSFEVQNTTDQKDWLLEIPFSTLDQVDFYYRDKSGWKNKRTGDFFPISSRELRHPNPVFKFQLEKGEHQKFFLRIKTGSSVQVAGIVWSPDVFFKKSYDQQIFNGLFYGALAVMMFYQLFLFVSTRDKVSLYYVFTLLSMIHVVSYFQGYSFLYVYPDYPRLNHFMAIISGPFFLIFSTALTRAFLNLKKINQFLDSLLVMNAILDVGVALLMIFFEGMISYRYHHFAVLMHSFFALAAAAYSIYRKFKPALFYLLSWLTLLIAAFVFSLSNLGVFSANITNSTWLIIGCILQILFVSFALGSRWNILTRETQNAKEQELKRGQIEKERLEFLVQLRTNEIQRQNEELEEVGRVKDKLFSVVSHDIKGPLTSLQLALGLVKTNTISKEEFQELTIILETRFKQTTEFIENLLQWASIQLKGIKFEPMHVRLNEIVGNTLKLLDYEIKAKGVVIQNEIADDLMVNADVNMVRSVLRNLIVNGIKFTSKQGFITLRAHILKNEVIVSVSDTGIGIPEANRGKLFSLDSITTLGTQKEKGTGLGLLICKEFVEKNGGRIWFESEEGKGATFFFTLRASDQI